MIEIRTYDGDVADAAGLIDRVWRQRYAGSAWAPFWRADCLRWQFFSDHDADGDLHLGAYSDAGLVGCLFVRRAAYVVQGRATDAAYGSCLTVDPAVGSGELGLALVDEARRRLVERRLAFMLGYVNGDPRTPANRFWMLYGRTYPGCLHLVRRLGYWVCALDPGVIRRAAPGLFERVAASLQSFVPLRPGSERLQPGVRPYAAGDLPRCARLITDASVESDLAQRFPVERLGAQLEWNHYPRTLVYDSPGEPFGFVNFHAFDLLGRDTVRTGLIDFLLADGRSQRVLRRLLRSAVGLMVRDGAALSMSMRSYLLSTGVMLSCGFVPVPESDHLVVVSADPTMQPPVARRPVTLFR
jgi:hypothetical protein